MTAGADLGGRAFLHSYDWRADDGLWHAGADPDRAGGRGELDQPAILRLDRGAGAFGGGNKLIHNVVGGIGVVQGNGGILRPGLPWQTVHDGEQG